MRTSGLCALTAVVLGAPLWATEDPTMQEPGWLTNVVAHGVQGSEAVRASSQSSNSGLTTEAIETKPLDGGEAAVVGVLPPEQSGIPIGIWGSSDAGTLARLMTPYLPDALPEITAFWHRLALAETEPPAKGAARDLLRARVDHLLNAGALDQAEALLESAPSLSPELFVRAFEAGLLSGRVEAACARLRSNPSLSPGFQARIFCLARAGDWAAAALTLRTAESLGQIPEAEAELIARFLDPELFEGTPPPPHPDQLSALDFMMREALLLPRAPGTLPLAFLHRDLEAGAPWRNRVIATERLTRSQALPPEVLMKLYLDGVPAASGGVWVRVEAVQSLVSAVSGGDPAKIGAALTAAFAALNEAGLGFALVPYAATELRDLPLEGAGARQRFDLWLMAPDYGDLVWDHAPANRAERILQAIATEDLADWTPQSDMEAAVRAGLTHTDLRTPLLWDVEQDRRGEAVLKALTSLVAARHADPQAVERTLAVLRRSGLQDEARRLAIQVLLRAEGRL